MSTQPEPFPDLLTPREKYGPAMEITTKEEADAYFERCVAHSMGRGRTRETAEEVERSNLGYFAGYCDAATQARVAELFAAPHPLGLSFGGAS